jgi:acetyl esterase
MVVRVLGWPRNTGEETSSARNALRLDWLNGDVSALRAAYERACGAADPKGSAWLDIGGEKRRLRALVHQPGGLSAPDCAIIYFHGGGWIVGSPSTHAGISAALCDATGLRVMSIDYRLAPEHKAPAPVEDGLLALSCFLAGQHAPIRLKSVFLCGDSAGAAIAMAVERSADDEIRGKIAGVLSVYGGFGLNGTKSMRAYGSREDGLDAECIKRYWALANRDESESPYSIAALAAPSHVPAYLLVCGRDPLRDDSLALARALKSKGREVIVDLVRLGTHGFLHERSELASGAIKRIAHWIDGTISGRARTRRG